MPRMVEQKIRSAVPLYLAAGAFLAASALLPIYQWWAIVLAGVLAAGVYWVADKKIPPRTVLVEQPYQTGSQDLDELLAQAQTRLDQLHTLNERIPDAALSAAILRMENAGAAILEKLSAEPEKARSARRFLAYYLPTAVKVLIAYADLEAAGADGENARALAAQVEQNAGTIARAFEAQLDSLFAGQVLDVSTDLEVLEAMAKSDGLTDGPQLTL